MGNFTFLSKESSSKKIMIAIWTLPRIATRPVAERLHLVKPICTESEPSQSVASFLSSQLLELNVWLRRQLNVQCQQHVHDSIKRRARFSVERPIQSVTTHSGLLRKPCHSLRVNHIANGFCDGNRIASRQCAIEIFGDRTRIVAMFFVKGRDAMLWLFPDHIRLPSPLKNRCSRASGLGHRAAIIAIC